MASIMEEFVSFSFRTFGKQLWVYRIVGEPSLAELNLPFMQDEFSSSIILMGVVLAAIGCSSFAFRLLGLLIIPLQYMVIIPVALFFLGMFIMKLYPEAIRVEMNTVLNNRFPYMVEEMAVLSSTGITFEELMERMGDREKDNMIKPFYQTFMKDIRLLGMDSVQAINDLIRRSPNDVLSNFLEGLKGAIVSGGNLSSYLNDYSKRLLNERRIGIRQMTERLNLLSEMYMLLFIVFPVTIIISLLLLTSIAPSVGGIPINMLLYIIAYVFMPVLGLAFLLLLDIMGPRG
ncbi:MAG: type II secretion system F family protein [Nitrososphaerota archaeon]|nr:type II secretion system F family protein [Nitrososphaerota archaeon]